MAEGKIAIDAEPVFSFMCFICYGEIPYDYGHSAPFPICQECRKRIRKVIYPERMYEEE